MTRNHLLSGLLGLGLLVGAWSGCYISRGGMSNLDNELRSTDR